MGFTKANALREITIPLAYQVRNHDKETIEDVDVVHIFDFPTTAQREKFQQELVLWKGRRAKTATSTAAWRLWTACINRVVGYDDLPQDASRSDLHAYFNNDDVCRLHVDDAINGLWDRISAEEGDFTKKFEPSSEE